MGKMAIDPGDEDFGAVLTCAVRYALGRETYMPGLVMDFIRPLLPHLDDEMLFVMERDISEQSKWGERAYGDPQIDKPMWMAFVAQVRKELDGRKHNATYGRKY